MAWQIPDDIDVVDRPPYGDDMTTSFMIDDQWYTMPYRLASSVRHNRNVELMEVILAQPRKYGLVRHVPVPGTNGFIYVVERT